MKVSTKERGKSDLSNEDARRMEENDRTGQYTRHVYSMISGY